MVADDWDGLPVWQVGSLVVPLLVALIPEVVQKPVAEPEAGNLQPDNRQSLPWGRLGRLLPDRRK